MEPKNLLERLEQMIHIAHGTNCTLTKIATPDAEKILELLKEQEAVVRCRDCKHYMTIHCTCDGCCISDDWYCADGERR